MFSNQYTLPVDPCNGAVIGTCTMASGSITEIQTVGDACGSINPLQTSLSITFTNGTTTTVSDQYGDLVLYCYDGNLTAKYAGVNYTDVADLTCGNDCVFDTYTDTNPPTELASICPTTGKWCVLPEGDSISFDAAAACGDRANIVFGSTSRPDTAGTVDLTCTDGVLLGKYDGLPYSFNFIGCSDACIFTAGGNRNWDLDLGVAPSGCAGLDDIATGPPLCVLKEGQTAVLDAGGATFDPPNLGDPGFCDNGSTGAYLGTATLTDPFDTVVINGQPVADNLGVMTFTCSGGVLNVNYGGVDYAGVTSLSCSCTGCLPGSDPLPGCPAAGCC
ncbi:MAG: hypothetical protein GY696_11415, partial [Gammaproteobacteria bacterium]|nr:hypothetical protein [Gammaproteobacteria bacterium]